jgi:hypothetical protein
MRLKPALKAGSYPAVMTQVNAIFRNWRNASFVEDDAFGSHPGVR